MIGSSSRGVDDVRSALAPFGLSVIELPADASTSSLAATALGTEVGAIVKSLLFYAEQEPVLVLAPGDRTVVPGVLASSVDRGTARLARPAEVLAVTGYAVGGVPPVAHAQALRVLIDRHVLGRDIVYAAAGATNAVFGVRPDLLREITGAAVVDVTE